jgi:hypothetical protein
MSEEQGVSSPDYWLNVINIVVQVCVLDTVALIGDVIKTKTVNSLMVIAVTEKYAYAFE